MENLTNRGREGREGRRERERERGRDGGRGGRREGRREGEGRGGRKEWRTNLTNDALISVSSSSGISNLLVRVREISVFGGWA